ncbi:AAA family ATPase [Methylomonas montana]|uniref:AAA family ATPase n=1 Tax=Methylomonas montana TaxID=3058963 RepID=UPI00265B2B30|nr:AAA family ATPase [Methylomonas montana]WKJ90114.1 AAA family ATPase [Methylomonas montana]
MLDNDNLTYSYQRRSVVNNAERALITLERSQKLDLLLHLLANLQQSLIVCGPEGIGKTTLLETVRQNRKDLWEIALLSASPSSSFESLITDLLRSLNITKASAFDLSALREFCAKQKVVLLVDDAGTLVPGLISTLMEFADSLPGLRLVFAMSHDQFHIKSGTDKAVEDCHFIELPPLNKKQCGEYLQNLSAQPGAVISFNAIGDALVDDLYRDTHGIPGKILAELPKLADYQNRKSSRLGLWLAIVAILAGAGFVVKSLLPPEFAQQIAGNMPVAGQASSIDNATTENIASLPVLPVPTPQPVNEPAAEQTQVSTPTSEPALSAPAPSPTVVSVPAIPESKPEHLPETVNIQPASQPASSETGATPISATTTPAPTEPVVNKPEAANADPLPAAEPLPQQAVEKPIERKPVKPLPEGSERDWIMAQPPGNYTLQVMVLSNKDAAIRFQKKYADYRSGLKYYPINKGDQEKYVVIYGSFQTVAEAQAFKAVMPDEFKQALEKRFSAVQKESRR